MPPLSMPEKKRRKKKMGSTCYRGSGVTRVEIEVGGEANLSRLEDFGFLLRRDPNFFLFFFNPRDTFVADTFEMSLGEYLPRILDRLPYVRSARFEEFGDYHV